MVFDSDVLDLWVPDIVLCQAACSFIVAVKKCGIQLGDAYAIEELTKEEGFIGSIMQHDVFSIAG